jgi:membrane protease YdiL (CAAX protease family)
MAHHSGTSAHVKGWVRAHPIVAFCLWFFPVAWTIALLPLVIERPFGVELPLEVFLSAATVIGGLVPVLVITRLIDGPSGLRTFLGRLLVARVPLAWYALALVATPLLSLAIAIVAYGPPNVEPMAALSALVNGLLVQGVLGFLAVNVWEEATWMGFVQARLQSTRGVWTAVVITAALFALQHLPLFVAGGLTNIAGLVVFVVFIGVAIPFRALAGWMYNRTGSLLLVGLLHAMGDATTNGSFGSGFLARLYDGESVGFLHIIALALIGVVVIAATRTHLAAEPARALGAGTPAAATA